MLWSAGPRAPRSPRSDRDGPWVRVADTAYDASTGALSWTYSAPGTTYFAYWAVYSYERHLSFIATCAKNPTATVTDAAWSAAEFRFENSEGAVRHRVSRTQRFGSPLPRIARVVGWLGPLAGVWVVVGSTPVGVASIFSTRVRAQVLSERQCVCGVPGAAAVPARAVLLG